MQNVSLNDLTTSEVVDLVQYANDMMEHAGVYPVEYTVYRNDLELELNDVTSIMVRMGYPALQDKMDS